MSKAVVAIIVIVIVALGVGFYLMQEDVVEQEAQQLEENGVDTEAETNGDLPQYLQGANIGETIDATGQDEVTVTVSDFLFETTILTLNPGTTVTWVNEGSVAHDVRSDAGSAQQGLASPLLAPGETYSFTFEEVGTYQYLCTPHPDMMRGIVEVVEG